MSRREHSHPGFAWLTRPRLGVVVTAVGAVGLLVVADRLDGGLPLPLTDQRLPAGILVLGLMVGSLDALLGMGLVVLYRAGRFINFAQGQLGAFAAVFGVAVSQHYRQPLVLGILAGFGAAALLAALSELVVVRRLFEAPRLVVTVASIGLAQVYAAMTLAVPKILDRNLDSAVTVDIGPDFFIDPVRFEGGSILTLAVVPLVCLGLVGLFRTDLGVSIRAVAENPARARLLGLRVRRVSTCTWVVAALLAATTGMLRAVNPAAGFSYGVVEGPSLILNGLTAAVIGGMTSLPVTFAAALGLGALEQSVLFVTGDPGDTDVAVLAVLLVTLLVRRRPAGRVAEVLAASGFVAVRAVRPVPEAVARLGVVRAARWAGAALLTTGLALLPACLGPSNLDLANSIVIVAMVALSLTVLTGYGGQVSLGQWAFVGVAATVGAVLVERGLDFGVGFVVVVVLGAALAAAVGLPALRVPGLFLAVTTLTFAVAVDTWLLELDSLQLREPTILRPLLFGVVDLTSGAAYYELSLVMLGLTMLVVRRLRHGPAGRDLVAVRDNPRAAAAYGVREGRAKLAAFAVSGAIAAAAGYLYAFQQELLTESSFSDRTSLQVFTIVVIGGLGSIPGALLGTVYVLGARYYLDEGLQFAATGTGLLALLLFAPEGLGGLVFRGRDAVVRRIAGRRGIALPGAVDDRPVIDRAVSAGGGPPRAAEGHRGERPVLLQVTGLRAGYDGVAVVDGIDLTVRAGDLVALLGTNGAGKSTLLRAISGALTPMAGSVVFEGRDLTGHGPERTVRRGIVSVPGGQGVFPGLTVHEHLRLAAVALGGRRAQVRSAQDEALDPFPQLRERWAQPAGTLSGGEQQMLTLAQALIARPRLLMIDELSLGLSPKVVGELVAVVEAIHRSGTAVILVEQSVNIALSVAEQAVFLEKGRVRFRGPTADLLDRTDLVRSIFLGPVT